MSAEETERLIEEAVTAWRPRGPRGELREHPAWCDLSAAGREEVFRRTAAQRALEAALAPDGISSTARSVLARIRRAGR